MIISNSTEWLPIASAPQGVWFEGSGLCFGTGPERFSAIVRATGKKKVPFRSMAGAVGFNYFDKWRPVGKQPTAEQQAAMKILGPYLSDEEEASISQSLTDI